MSQPQQTYRSVLNDPNYKGEKTPKHLSEGPKQDRGCTDIFMLLLFIASWGGFLYVSFMGFKNGDPNKFAKPYDIAHNQCGMGAASSYPYLYFCDPGLSNGTVCVQSCPANDSSTLQAYSDNCGDNYYVTASSEFLSICIPLDDAIANNVTSALGISSFQKSVADIESIWYMLFAIAGIALAISFVYTLLVRYCSGLMTWGILLLYLVLLGLFGYFCLESASNPNAAAALGNTVKNFSQESLKIMGIISFVLLGLSLITICLLFHKIELTIAVLKCAAQFVEDLPSIILIPPLFFVILLGYTIFWIFSFVFVVSTNDVTVTGRPYPDIDWTSTTEAETGFLIFVFLWNHFFFLALPQFVIASACVCWYFRKASGERLGHPVAWSLCSSLWKHMGSIAFGALVLAIVEAIKLIMDYVHAKMKATTGDQNAVGFCLKCVGCCLDCFERFVMFVNKHAFVQIAMTGENFCKAAQEAFYLIARYTVSLGLVHGIGEIFVWIGTLFITAVTTLIGYILLTKTELNTKIYSPTFPTIIFAVISFIVGSNFMSVYGTSADTIIHCYCMDDEIHEDQGGPQHAPPLLRDFVTNHPRNKPLHQRLIGSGDQSN